MNIRSEIKNIEKNIIDWRRDFHQYPELGFDEHRTSKIIGEALKEMGLAPKMNVGKTGVTADLTFGEGPTIALRADMDALPMQETSELDFSSKHDDELDEFYRLYNKHVFNFNWYTNSAISAVRYCTIR